MSVVPSAREALIAALERRQRAVDEALGLLVLEVRDFFPVDSVVYVTCGNGGFVGSVRERARSRRQVVEVAVQPALDPRCPAWRPKTRWFDYRKLSHPA